MFAVESKFRIDKVMHQHMGDHIDPYPRKKRWQEVQGNRQLGNEEKIVSDRRGRLRKPFQLLQEKHINPGNNNHDQPKQQYSLA